MSYPNPNLGNTRSIRLDNEGKEVVTGRVLEVGTDKVIIDAGDRVFNILENQSPHVGRANRGNLDHVWLNQMPLLDNVAVDLQDQDFDGYDVDAWLLEKEHLNKLIEQEAALFSHLDAYLGLFEEQSLITSGDASTYRKLISDLFSILHVLHDGIPGRVDSFGWTDTQYGFNKECYIVSNKTMMAMNYLAKQIEKHSFFTGLEGNQLPEGEIRRKGFTIKDELNKNGGQSLRNNTLLSGGKITQGVYRPGKKATKIFDLLGDASVTE